MSLLPTAADLAAAAAAGLADGAAAPDVIRVRGARVHNLRNLDLDLPREKLVVITGPSGSGKSSLAFDTLFAEGQRQYIESLSVYARQFLHQLERPDVDLIEGLQPTVCIDQRPGQANPRSTVATVTEIYDYLRLLFARVGEAKCYQCGSPVKQQTPEQIQARILALPQGTKAMLLAPIIRGRKGAHAEVFQQIRKAGFVRARVDGEVFDLEGTPTLEPRKSHTIEAVVDRVVIRAGQEGRLAESLRQALSHGEGLVGICYHVPESEPRALATGGPRAQTPPVADAQGSGDNARGTSNGWTDEIFSTKYACPACGVNYQELEPRTFSFNSPYGACPTCDGLGVQVQFDPDLLIPDRERSLEGRAVAPWRGISATAGSKVRDEVEPFLASKGLTWETPLSQFTPAAFDKLLAGDGKKFLGILTLLDKEFVATTSDDRLTLLGTFRGEVPCSACGGSRLRPEATSVEVGGKPIHQVTALSIGAARGYFAGLTFNEERAPIGEPLVTEISKRLAFLDKVGVGYLTLDRAADTLSGGELQRVRLATGIGSGLVGCCYILDEPSIGLHPRDNERLIEALRDLQRQGNSVIVVEHDEAMMREADWLLDMGPAAGTRGGQIVARGTPREVMADPQSLTGRYLAGATAIPLPAARRKTAKTRSLLLEGATTNNLRSVDLRIPLGALVCVTGVSGSGKSSLINETLARAIARRLGTLGPKPGPHSGLKGVSQIDKLVEIDQSPIGRSPRSNAATYTGVFDEVRKVFAATRDAKQRGFTASRFSFNTKGGRCEECQGQGLKKIEMNFLPDLYVECDVCHGRRFNDATLAIKYKGKSIADVLALPVDEGVEYFENLAGIQRLILALRDVGLGYLPLGQPSTTLSGGEAQRIKLATELGRVDTGNTLYLLDEPTTGLHFDDIRRLMEVLGRLVDRGNTVLVIEHNLDVVKCADWIIDLGPDGGAAGGEIVAAGTPEEVAQCERSITGQFLRSVLSSNSK